MRIGADFYQRSSALISVPFFRTRILKSLKSPKPDMIGAHPIVGKAVVGRVIKDGRTDQGCANRVLMIRPARLVMTVIEIVIHSADNLAINTIIRAALQCDHPLFYLSSPVENPDGRGWLTG